MIEKTLIFIAICLRNDRNIYKNLATYKNLLDPGIEEEHIFAE